MYRSQMNFGQRMAESTELSQERAQFIKATYGHLLYGVMAAIIGAYVSANSPLIMSFFTGTFGWIVAMGLLYFIPNIAVKFRHDPVRGFLGLVLNGFIGGLVLGPIVYIAGQVAVGQNLVLNALMITGMVFTGVTAFVWTSGKRYEARRGLMGGIFIALIGAIVINIFMPTGILGMLISIGIGIMGVLILVYATSDILHNPELDSPIVGALMLFAGLFNVFTMVIHLLLAFTGGSE